MDADKNFLVGIFDDDDLVLNGRVRLERDVGHGFTPETVSRILTIVRFASSTLNAVPGTVNGF